MLSLYYTFLDEYGAVIDSGILEFMKYPGKFVEMYEYSKIVKNDDRSRRKLAKTDLSAFAANKCDKFNNPDPETWCMQLGMLHKVKDHWPEPFRELHRLIVKHHPIAYVVGTPTGESKDIKQFKSKMDFYLLWLSNQTMDTLSTLEKAFDKDESGETWEEDKLKWMKVGHRDKDGLVVEEQKFFEVKYNRLVHDCWEHDKMVEENKHATTEKDDKAKQETVKRCDTLEASHCVG